MRKLALGNGQIADVSGDTIISVAKGAEAAVVMKPHGDARIVLKAGEQSVVRCYMVCEEQAEFAQTSHVGAHAAVYNSFLWLSGVRATVHNILEGKGAEAYDLHAFIGRKNDSLVLDSVLHHNAPGTRGDILVKGVVKDAASAFLGGMIKIEKGGAGAESFLAEHVMLLGPDAKASANPELEIENNDVSSRHSASVSQIDGGKLFYLMSRGVEREAASSLIVEGFLESAIGRIHDAKWRDVMMNKARKALMRQ